MSEAVGMAALSAKHGKASDESGLSNACMKSIRADVVKCIADILQENGGAQEAFPEQWKQARGLLLHKKGTERVYPTTGY